MNPLRIFGAALAASAVLLSGCGAIRTDDDASYFMVSMGSAGGVVAPITGNVDYCKVTQSNLAGSEYLVSVEFNGDSCAVEAVANDKSEE